METRGDYEVLSAGRMIWPLLGLLTALLALTHIAEPLPSANRLTDLAVFLDDHLAADIERHAER